MSIMHAEVDRLEARIKELEAENEMLKQPEITYQVAREAVRLFEHAVRIFKREYGGQDVGQEQPNLWAESLKMCLTTPPEESE